MFSRREFLSLSGLAAGVPLLTGVSPWLAPEAVSWTVKGDKKFFVLIRVFNGMDVTLGLDPWTAPALPDAKDMFIEYRPEEVIAAGGEIKLAPAAAVMAKHAGQMSIVNGIFMSQIDNGHPASQTYISAGSTRPGAPVLPVEVAYSTTEGNFGVLTNSALDMGSRSVASSTTGDLESLGSRIDLTAVLSAIFASGSADSAYFQSVKKVMASRDSVQVFLKNLAAFQAQGPIEPMHVLAAAFLTEVSFDAQLDFSSFNLDTHAAHPVNHLKEQKKAWDAVDGVFSLFKKVQYGGGSLFDATTFLVVSEFSRTPALNGSNGKDHNPLTNSALLAGRGIQGGRVLGASKLVTAAESPTGASYHIAYPIDFATGQVQTQRTPAAQMIFPEHLAQTVATIMGVDRGIFQSVDAKTPALPRIMS